jgi:ABC-type multidrug transport system ATPase subunit
MTKQSTPITLSIEGLSKRFNREWIFRNFSYEFKPGNVYAITGPNGSGKSTLLSILWGQVPPTTGTLKYSHGNVEIPVEEIHNYVSIATPYMDLIEDFTLQESLEFHFKLKPVRSNFSHQDLLEIFYLTESRDKYIRNFSSGMKQRLKLGLAMFTQSNLIYLDEPGAHLDEAAFQWYRTQLTALPGDCIIFIASNDPTEYQGASHILDLKEYKRSPFAR